MPEQSPSPWRVVFYKDRRGRSPIAEYLNALPVVEQAAAAERRLAEVLTGGIEDG